MTYELGEFTQVIKNEKLLVRPTNLTANGTYLATLILNESEAKYLQIKVKEADIAEGSEKETKEGGDGGTAVPNVDDKVIPSEKEIE